jgi:hypothetical protein
MNGAVHVGQVDNLRRVGNPPYLKRRQVDNLPQDAILPYQEII